MSESNGGWALWDQTRPGIYLDQDRGLFAYRAGCDLNRIISRPVGARLISLIVARHRGVGTQPGKCVFVTQADDISDVGATVPLAREPDTVRRPARAGSIVRIAGPGSSVIVRYDAMGKVKYTLELGVPTPAFIGLAHELIHALRDMSGDKTESYDWKTQGALREEAKTVGLAIYAPKATAPFHPGSQAGPQITENAIRAEHGLAPRTYYDTPGDAGALTSLTG